MISSLRVPSSVFENARLLTSSATNEVAEEGEARGGVGVGPALSLSNGWSVQPPVRGENLAGFLQLAGQEESEHQMVAAIDGQRMDVPEQLCRGRCHSPVHRFSQPECLQKTRCRH